MYLVKIAVNELENKFIINPEFMLETKKELDFMIKACFENGYEIRIHNVGEDE